MLSSITTKQRNGALLGIGTVAALGAGLYYLSKNSPKPDAKPRVRNTTNLGLSQAIAEERRANLQGDVAHEVYLLYLDGKKKYRGCIRLTFHSSGEGELYLDFTGKVLRLQVNNETIDDSLVNGSAGLHDGALLRLPRDFIVEGKNLVTIDFECTPSNDCSGHTLTNNPHQLKGSDEKYYYGWNECYGQKNMIPNFEQPDVRGTYKLFVCAPMTWAVTSNEKKCGFHDALDLHFIKMGGKEDHSHEHLESHAGDDHQFLQACHNRLFVIPPGQTHTDYTVREFHNTEPFPSYLFCVYAGHMEMCTSSIMHRDLKFRIFAPSYQAGPLQRCADLWANMHMYGLKFYEQLLGVEYPYSKYDATLTPHMSITFGACEYPGNVIFQEPCLEHNYGNFVYTRVFLIILHEMAHMWFGNLVSLRWWDDLWLKEGFADLCTHYAMIAFQKEMPEWVPAFGPAGHRFKGSQWVPTEVTFSVRKTGGMIEDITPHFRRGLKTDCKLSQDQIALYNRVTYGKSYAVLHEMFNLLGGEDFFGKWSKFYLTKYANKATDFEDFTGSLIQALTAKGVSPEMVRTVTHDHIKMPGADTLEFEIDFAENLITIYQHPFTPGHYRHHYFDIALFGQDGKFLELLTVNMPNVQNFQVSFEESSVNFEILPNYSNFGYFFQDLDEGQRSFFELNSNNLDCKALSMVNQCLYLDVLQGKLLIDQYLDFAVELLKKKPYEFMFSLCNSGCFIAQLVDNTDSILNQHILERVWPAIKKIGNFWPKDDFTWLEVAWKFAPTKKNKRQLFDLFWDAEVFATLREKMSVNSLRRWVSNCYWLVWVPEEQKTMMAKRLQTKDYKSWLALRSGEDARLWDKNALRNFWEEVLVHPMEQDWWMNETARRTAFMLAVDKAEFEGGYFEEYFRNFLRYFQTHDWANCNLFMNLCPKGGNDQLHEKFSGLLADNAWSEDERMLIQGKLRSLEMKILLKSRNF